MCNRVPDKTVFSKRSSHYRGGCSTHVWRRSSLRKAIEWNSVAGAFLEGRTRPSTPHLPSSQAASCFGPVPLTPLPGPFCSVLLVNLCPQERFMALLLMSLEWLLSTGGKSTSTTENVRFPRSSFMSQSPTESLFDLVPRCAPPHMLSSGPEPSISMLRWLGTFLIVAR